MDASYHAIANQISEYVFIIIIIAGLEALLNTTYCTFKSAVTHPTGDLLYITSDFGPKPHP